MKLTNQNIVILKNILSPLKLSVEDSLSRRRFLRLFKNAIEAVNEEGEDIRQKYSEKNPDGSMKKIDNLIQYSKENRKKADADFKTLNDSEVDIDFTGNEKDKDFCMGLVNKEIERFTLEKKGELTADECDYLEEVKGAIK